MKEEFAKYQKACGDLGVEDDEHELTITDNEIIVRNGMDTCRWVIGEAVPEVPCIKQKS